MPLDSILQALEAETERQIAEIEGAARIEVERIRAQAQAEATLVRQRHMAAIRAPLAAEQARILTQAKLEALRVVMGTREAIIASALDAAAGCLAQLVATECYADLLQRLTQEAIDALGVGSQLLVRVRSHDVDLMRGIAEKMDLSATVEGGLESESSRWGCLGGVAVTTPDGRISLINTLDARLQRVATLYRFQIAEMVFGDRQED